MAMFSVNLLLNQERVMVELKFVKKEKIWHKIYLLAA